MNHPSVSGAPSDVSAKIEPDKRWVGSLLCCLSALVTTIVIVMAASFLTSTDNRNIAQGNSPGINSPGINSMEPADEAVSD